ncbi:MAG: hypothetical protein KTU85_11555 [Acidimicrobiia bacterium]|nr:hypothetical protein [Acidimicrobiia bacterium]
MMSIESVGQIPFERDDFSAVVAAMAEIAFDADTDGWVNIGPLLTVEKVAQVPTRNGLGSGTSRGDGDLDISAPRWPVEGCAGWC